MAFNSELNLANLDGDNGFIFEGIQNEDYDNRVGKSVSGIGDINGDGIDDLLIGAPYTKYDNPTGGYSYVLFGNQDGFAEKITPSQLDQTNSLKIDGIGDSSSDFLSSGYAVSEGGDINGDGIDDLIISSPYNKSTDFFDYDDNAGLTYVVFGNENGFNQETLSLSDLNGTNGFYFSSFGEGDYSGNSISNVGDINGDNVDDLIVGAPYADPNGNTGAGESYVIFGKKQDQDFRTTLSASDLDGGNGFVIEGIGSYDNSGQAVSDAGDFNGDGLNDLLIGAPDADLDTGQDDAGESYVVFGKDSGFGPSFELATLASGNGSQGFVIEGIQADDLSGFSLSSAGDINGDGLDDIIISAPYADRNGYDNVGESYVIFGTEGGFNDNLDLSSLDGNNGFKLNGPTGKDGFGFSVSGAGDINDDGFDDLIIGVPGGDPQDTPDAGESFVLFGQSSGFGNLSDSDFLRINGINSGDASGTAVDEAGDINGDDIDDLVIGTPAAKGNAGQAYTVFGQEQERATPPVITPPDAPITISEDFQEGDEVFTVEAPDGDEMTFEIASGNSDVDGDGTAPFAIDDEGIVTVQDADDLEEDNSFNLDIVATDEEGVESAPVTFNLEVEATPEEPPQFVGAPFTFNPIDVAEAENGDEVGTVPVEEPENATFEFIEGNTDIDGDGTAAFAIADDGVVTIADVDDLESDFQLTVEATNEFGSNEANITIPFTIGDSFPVITPPDAPITISEDFQEGDEVFTVEATDPAGDEITFEITSGNSDVDGDGTAPFAIDDEGIVTVQDADDLEEDNSFNLDIVATDEEGVESAPVTFDLEVAEVNDPPEVANSIDNQEATKDDSFNFQVPENTFSDPDDSSLTLSASLADGSELPDWLIFDPDNRLFIGTPGEEDDGSFEIEVTASDSEDETASTSFTLNVEEVQDNEAPAFEQASFSFNLNPDQADEFSKTVTATDPEQDEVSFEITEGNDPDGNGTNAFAIDNEGTITVADAEELEGQEAFNLTVQASDGELTSTANVEINVGASVTATLDIGGNGEVDQPDALLLLGSAFGDERFMESVIEDANANSFTPNVDRNIEEVNSFIQNNETLVDIGGNGEVDQPDALLLLGSAFGDERFMESVIEDANANSFTPNVDRNIEEVKDFIEANSP